MNKTVYLITLQDTGETFHCREDEFILHAMRTSRCGSIHCGCYGGGCGVCKMKLISGKVFQEKNMSREHITEEEKENGYLLTCCVKPR